MRLYYSQLDNYYNTMDVVPEQGGGNTFLEIKKNKTATLLYFKVSWFPSSIVCYQTASVVASGRLLLINSILVTVAKAVLEEVC